MKNTAPYGTWSSHITGNFVAEYSRRIGAPTFLGDRILWLEARPAEQGRQVIVMRNADGDTEDLLPSPWSARSRVHEYGGGAFTAIGNSVYFVNGDDQQIYVMDIHQRTPKAITQTHSCRYADLSLNQQQTQLLAVCERHDNTLDEPENLLVRIDLNQQNLPVIQVDSVRIGKPHDFYSNPRFSPCGQWISYLSWDHPNMPWDNTQLWLLSTGNNSDTLHISGDGNESITQPKWSAEGDLFWVSDKSNWWNIYCLKLANIHHAETTQCIYSAQAEFATPQWVFGMSSYCFIDSKTIFATYTKNGHWHALQLTSTQNQWQPTPISSDLIHFAELAGGAQKAVFTGASAVTAMDLYLYENGRITPLSTQQHPPMSLENKSIGQIIRFPTGKNQAEAHGVFYPPQNSQYQAPKGDKPPVIVFGHGGPTGACDAFFSYKIQFWTQRGFAVVEVNYRGSTGYGREFRHSLHKNWGIYDVEDLSSAAEFLSQQGWVHPKQRVVRGGSAGGFSVLAALTDTDTFNAGCTLYGVGDLETLATDTHKFESRYLDSLIGPYPAEKQIYIERSPIHKVANISCPILVFQGAEDKVVPPAQAQVIVNAVKNQGLPVAYVLYKNEAHGFRRAENIQHQAEAELYFYQQVLGLTTKPKDNPPITIDNWTNGL